MADQPTREHQAAAEIRRIADEEEYNLAEMMAGAALRVLADQWETYDDSVGLASILEDCAAAAAALQHHSRLAFAACNRKRLGTTTPT